MSKEEFIQRIIKGMGSDSFGRGRLRQKDRRQWLDVCKAEACRLGSLGYSELETLYHKSTGVYELAE